MIKADIFTQPSAFKQDLGQQSPRIWKKVIKPSAALHRVASPKDSCEFDSSGDDLGIVKACHELQVTGMIREKIEN